MRYTYEFELYKGEKYLIAAPFDFGGATFGDGYIDAIDAASDWLAETIKDYLLHNKKLPEPTFENSPIHNGRIVALSIETSLDTIPTMLASQAANKLGVTRARITQLMDSGSLEGYKKGNSAFVTVSSVEARLKDKPRVGRPKESKADLFERRQNLMQT